MRRRLGIGLGVFLGLGGLGAWLGVGPVLQVVGGLVFGWWSYLARVVPQVAVSGDGVITGLLGLLLFTIGLHLFLRWLHGEIRRGDGTPGREIRGWRPRWTASIVAVVMLMFAAGIGATGIVHQVGWLLSSRRPHLVARLYDRDSLFGGGTEDHLREIGSGLQGYGSAHETLPIGKADAWGRRLHSWQTAILPYLSILPGGEIHDDLPWDDPRNSAYFRGIVLPYLNPEIGALRSREGYALSHYAGNVHLLGRDRPSSTARVTENAAGTILAGEVSSRFQPWGDPTNLRDPALGIHRSPEGFGGPSPGGANFLFADGSVRLLKDTIDPRVLKSLSTPAGGDRGGGRREGPFSSTSGPRG